MTSYCIDSSDASLAVILSLVKLNYIHFCMTCWRNHSWIIRVHFVFIPAWHIDWPSCVSYNPNIWNLITIYIVIPTAAIWLWLSQFVYHFHVFALIILFHVISTTYGLSMIVFLWGILCRVGHVAWWTLLGLQSWYPYLSNACNSSKVRMAVYGIYDTRSSDELQWLGCIVSVSWGCTKSFEQT